VSDGAGGSHVLFWLWRHFLALESRIPGLVSGASGEKLFYAPLWHRFVKKRLPEPVENQCQADPSMEYYFTVHNIMLSVI
jgi:hypothetical protein